jgi:hypothetical protein
MQAATRSDYRYGLRENNASITAADGAGTAARGRSGKESCRPSPPSLSTHVGQSPAAQFAWAVSACSLPRCSVQPGQEHCAPQQHPREASTSPYGEARGGASITESEIFGAGTPATETGGSDQGGRASAGGDSDCFGATCFEAQHEDFGAAAGSGRGLVRLGWIVGVGGEMLRSRTRFAATFSRAFAGFGAGETSPSSSAAAFARAASPELGVVVGADGASAGRSHAPQSHSSPHSQGFSRPCTGTFVRRGRIRSSRTHPASSERQGPLVSGSRDPSVRSADLARQSHTSSLRPASARNPGHPQRVHARRGPGGSAPIVPLHRHLPCTRFFSRSSLHFSHCATGRPLRATSNRGRSLCRHALERWPLMHAWLGRHQPHGREACSGPELTMRTWSR